MADAMVALPAEVAQLAKEFVLEQGKMSLPTAAFEKWLAAHRAVPVNEKESRARHVVALAVHFHREAGAAAATAVDQLSKLAAELLGEPKAAAALRSAGVGLGPQPTR
jgi:hypothetical protein